jgi:hypothetical protein
LAHRNRLEDELHPLTTPFYCFHFGGSCSYRGASVILGTYPPPMQSRPGLLNNVVQGNFGVTVPLQEIPATAYTIKPLDEVKMAEFDALQIPGAFNPWNMVAAGRPLEFLKTADAAGKVLAYICHGPIPIAAADLVRGKKVAGWLAVQDAVKIMGGVYNRSGPPPWTAGMPPAARPRRSPSSSTPSTSRWTRQASP